MKCSLYVIHDRVTEQFGEIFEAPNDATVRRSFSSLFQKQFSSGIPVKDLAILCLAEVDKSGSVPVFFRVPVPYTVLRGDEISYVETPEKSSSPCPGSCGQEVVHDSASQA